MGLTPIQVEIQRIVDKGLQGVVQLQNYGPLLLPQYHPTTGEVIRDALLIVNPFAFEALSKAIEQEAILGVERYDGQLLSVAGLVLLEAAMRIQLPGWGILVLIGNRGQAEVMGVLAHATLAANDNFPSEAPRPTLVIPGRGEA